MKENENCLTKSKENLESDIKIYIEKLEDMEQKIALSEKKNENSTGNGDYDDLHNQYIQQSQQLESLQKQLTSLVEQSNIHKENDVTIKQMKENLSEKDKLLEQMKESNDKKKKEIVSLINENKELKSQKSVKAKGGKKSKKMENGIDEDELYDITKLITENRLVAQK